jgi:short-subunit dehydrogenase
MIFNTVETHQVIKFTDEFRKKQLSLHILLNNAGIMMCPFELSKDGIEVQFATNHVGHFLLTRRLLDILVQTKPSRIVNVSSDLHTKSYNGGIAFDTINDEKQYSKFKAYGQSKLANILFTRELVKRLNNSNVYINTLHPGVIATDLSRNMGFVKHLKGVLLSPDTGCLTSLYATTSPEVEEKQYNGEYFVTFVSYLLLSLPSSNILKQAPIGVIKQTSADATDVELMKKLWDFTEKLIIEKVGKEHLPDLPQAN